MERWKVLLIGGGGREHALAHFILQSPKLKELKVYPGNGGIPNSLLIQNGKIGWKVEDKETFQNYIKSENFDLVVVGPEEPLVNGLGSWCREVGIPCYGPGILGAKLEGSKEFAKKIMKEANVPTAHYESFTEYEKALSYVQTKGAPIVIKADGLAAGKGVTVCFDINQAKIALEEIFIHKKFGESGNKVVIEEYLEGEEASIFAICDGKNFLLLPAAQDHKRAFDGDTGPNTGGMGAYCPAPVVKPETLEQIQKEIISPIINKMAELGEPYIGTLYAGLMIGKDHKAKVIEFNCRFGDPETQAVLLLIENDLLELLMKAATCSLSDLNELNIYPGYASVVVVAAEGYPGDYVKNIPLDVIDELQPIHEIKNKKDEIIIFHAGTKRTESGNLISSGGRIFGIANRSKNLKESIDKNYEFLDTFHIPSTFYRKDIGRRAL